MRSRVDDGHVGEIGRATDDRQRLVGAMRMFLGGVVGSLLCATTACMPRPEPAQPASPPPPAYGQPYAQGYGQPQPGQPQPGQPQPGQPQPGQPQPGQPQTGQPQPGQPQTGQPQPGQPQVPANGHPAAGQPANGQQPYPPNGQQAYPPNGQQAYPPNAQQPYPPNGQQPYPPPYGQQPAYYPQQPYPYPPPQPYPPPPIGASDSRAARLHDGEVIADFAVVGTFAAINFLARADVENSSAISFALIGGLAGGGGLGYLLTEKYNVDGGAARATTLGLMLGMANGALLIEPTGWTRSESVVNMLFLGGGIGAGAGFAYGQAAKLTPGQATFVGNLMLLGSATAALGAITGSRDGEYGGTENTILAVGLNGGAVAGALIAPSLDWSPRRARVVIAATAIGALVGGMMSGMLAKPDDGDASEANGNIVAATMTAGMWGGFGLGVLMTKHSPPDAKFAQPQRNAAASTTAVAPFVSDRGQFGLMAGGVF